jgi:hypothetical protein
MRISLVLLSIIALLPLAACGPDPSGGGQSSSASSAAASSAGTAAMIEVKQPLPGAHVSSPLTVAGQARGGWYFEASFPVHLLDADRNEIVSAPAQAQGDWMTTEFVPFTVTLNFTTAAHSGFLVLEKDNPSGLPENAASVEIPVTF